VALLRHRKHATEPEGGGAPVQFETIDRTADVCGRSLHYRETRPTDAALADFASAAPADVASTDSTGLGASSTGGASVSALPIIALHGHPRTAESWDAAAPGLCAAVSRPVLALTQRGYGASDRALSYAFPEFAADVLGFADALGLDRFVLLGHSMGGAVAALAAALRPSRVAALVLEDSVLPRDASELAVPPRPEGDLPYDWATALAMVHQFAAPDPGWWESLRRISAPTLVIGGGSTSHVPQQLLADAVAVIPDARLVTLDGTGHTPHRTHTELFVATVADFLGAPDPRRPASA
jgi:pimeloyl-ACP methyl ester carboxylesterase